MNQVQVEQKTYEMPPQEGFTVAFFLTVADVERSVRFYETVFGGRIVSKGDSNGLPGYIQIANTWLIVNVGGGPTPEKPSVTLGVLPSRIRSAALCISGLQIFRRATSFGKAEGPRLLQIRRTSTARRYAISAIRTAILSKLRKTSRASLMAKGRDTHPYEARPTPICRPKSVECRACASARVAQMRRSRA